MMTDPIADMLTRIRNAYMAKKQSVDVPFSKLKMNIAEILMREGYLGNVKENENDGTAKKILVLDLKYVEKLPAIQSLKRESKPGHRKYSKSSEMPKVLNNFGVAIISTPKGIMTNKEARKQNLGGEIICSVY
jgi:small subunit ribosomal protein S8